MCVCVGGCVCVFLLTHCMCVNNALFEVVVQYSNETSLGPLLSPYKNVLRDYEDSIGTLKKSPTSSHTLWRSPAEQHYVGQ